MKKFVVEIVWMVERVVVGVGMERQEQACCGGVVSDGERVCDVAVMMEGTYRRDGGAGCEALEAGRLVYCSGFYITTLDDMFHFCTLCRCSRATRE